MIVRNPCSTDAADYVDGRYTQEIQNTATIEETAQSGSATVTKSCAMPRVGKTAAATYVRKYEWAIVKSVMPAAQSGFAGDAMAGTTAML